MAKYQKYAEYKNSGVEWLGKIPSDWKVVKLNYKLKLLSGDGITAFDIEDTGTYPVFGGNGLRGFTEQYNCDGEYALIGRQGALCGNINVARGKFFATEHAVVVYPYETFNLTFLSEFLRFMDLGQYSVSAAQPGIAVDRINTLPIVIPTLGEQNAIGAFLDHETAQIDTLIAKQEKLIELLKEKRQAVISHAVTKGLNPDVTMKDSGVEWLGRVPEHWGIWKFSHIAPIITCGVASTPTYVDESEGMPFLSAQNIKNNKLSLHKFNHIPYALHEQLTRYRRPERGDILVTRVGAGIGEACIVDIDLEFSIYVSLTHIRVRPEIAHNKFIMYFFGTDYCKFLNFDGTVTGGGVGNLNVNNVVKYRIALPTIEEQKQITDYLDNYIEKQDQLIAKAESAIQLMQERRTALISSAVTGKIDVRNWQYPNEATTELSQ